MSTKNIPHKLIDASRLLAARFPKPKTEYQHGWNDALTTACEVETEIVVLRERENEDEKKQNPIRYYR